MKVIVGFVICGDVTAKYLPYFLPSLKNQTFKDFKIIAFNNGSAGDENEKYLRANYPEIEIGGEGKNLGFAAAGNRMIKKAVLERADYFLIANPDMIFSPDVLEKLVGRLENDEELGAVCPKILKWDFAGNIKTEIVDTYGIGLKSGLRFFDVGQGRKDEKKFRYLPIIGPSGACGLYRLASLEKIKEDGQYFDEKMFMYKEDCDLAYRLYLIGQGGESVPEAVVYHDRTASAAGSGDLAAVLARQGKSPNVRRWSVVNQEVIFRKYWHLQGFLSKLNIIFYRLKVIFYLVFFERFLLKEYFEIRGLKGKIKEYR